MSNDLRINSYIQPVTVNDSRIKIFGFPSDEGVKTNNGRPGASKAPQLIFEQFLKLTPHPLWLDKHVQLLGETSGMQTIECTGIVADDQQSLGKPVGKCIESGSLPVILGGGHETSFGHFLGYAGANKTVHIINIDAHADVRLLKKGKPHSGSPFRQALEHESALCKSYNVFGLNPASVSADHLHYVELHGMALFERDLRLGNVLRWFDSNRDGSVMVTMDMDVVRQADAPGVSAPNASGITKKLWLKLAFEMGKQPNVTSFDLCEVNPHFDRDGQTVKLAALTVWWFLLGVALREHRK